MREIKLTKGQVAIVCDCHYDLVKNYKWFALYIAATKTYYAARNSTFTERIRGKRNSILMHKVINHTPDGMLTDHENQNTLDNRCSNLRNATHSQNGMTRGKQSNNTSGHKGVVWLKRRRKWLAVIKINGKQRYIGHFNSPEDAARAYDSKAKELFGEYAESNLP